MILFPATLTIKKIEKKSFPKKDGGMFEYYEAICESDGKKPTAIALRVSDEALDGLTVGLKAEMSVGITSYEGKDGRIWSNFVFMGKKDIAQPAPAQPFETALMDGDEIPF